MCATQVYFDKTIANHHNQVQLNEICTIEVAKINSQLNFDPALIRKAMNVSFTIHKLS